MVLFLALAASPPSKVEHGVRTVSDRLVGPQSYRAIGRLGPYGGQLMSPGCCSITQNGLP